MNWTWIDAAKAWLRECDLRICEAETAVVTEPTQRHIDAAKAWLTEDRLCYIADCVQRFGEPELSYRALARLLADAESAERNRILKSEQVSPEFLNEVRAEQHERTKAAHAATIRSNTDSLWPAGVSFVQDAKRHGAEHAILWTSSLTLADVNGGEK